VQAVIQVIARGDGGEHLLDALALVGGGVGTLKGFVVPEWGGWGRLGVGGGHRGAIIPEGLLLIRIARARVRQF